jgi:hypothetical protein
MTTTYDCDNYIGGGSDENDDDNDDNNNDDWSHENS